MAVYGLLESDVYKDFPDRVKSVYWPVRLPVETVSIALRVLAPWYFW